MREHTRLRKDDEFSLITLDTEKNGVLSVETIHVTVPKWLDKRILLCYIYHKYVITINIKPFLCFDSQNKREKNVHTPYYETSMKISQSPWRQIPKLKMSKCEPMSVVLAWYPTINNRNNSAIHASFFKWKWCSKYKKSLKGW